MTALTPYLGRAAAALCLLSLALLVVFAFGKSGPCSTMVRAHLGRVERDLGFLRSSVTAKQVVVAELVLLSLAALTALFGWYVVAASSCVIVAAVPFVIARKRAERVERLEQQVEAWLGALGNALRASASLGEAIASTAALLRDPMSSELELVVKEYKLGCPLDRALEQASERIGSTTFRAAVAILKTARRTGGNLPDTLGHAAENLREMARLEGVVRTKTAEGKAQAFVISAVPVPLYLAIRLMSPDFFRPLETSFLGHVVFGAAAVLWVTAFLLARRILAVDI